MFGNRRADHGPDLSERRFDVGDRRAAHLDAGVAPRVNPLTRVADPHPPDAEAGDETDAPINRNHLAMVTTDPTERAIETRRVVASDFDAAGA